MVGSSLRNAVHRRNHKERSQPVGRAKLGLLEKHKDYVLRAKDHHQKRDKLKRLAEKAAMRNKDEFYFGMLKSQTKNGVHIQERGEEILGNDVVALLKTQDVGYVRAQLLAEKKRIQALVSRIAPSIPNLRTSWLDEKENRKPTLQKAGLISGSSSGKKGKQNSQPKTIGAQGKKTIWLDDTDSIRAYASSSTTSTSSQNPSSSSASGQNRIDDDSLEEHGESDWLDELSSSSEFGDEGDDSFAPTSEELLADKQARQSPNLRQGEKHLGYLVSELASRYERLEKLQLAAEKLNLVRALMTNKGGSRSNKVQRKESLTNAVMTGKVTKNGLAMPGVEDEDLDSSTSGTNQRKLYKFSSERKR